MGCLLSFRSVCVAYIELQQIEDKYVGLCGSVSSLMNEDQFSTLITQLGFNPDLCHQCFKYVYAVHIICD